MSAAAAPESPTLAERLIGLVHLPYPLGCIVMTGVLFTYGLAIVYLETSDFALALERAGWLQPTVVIPGLVFVYIFYAPHYMRRTLLKAERSLVPLLPEGEEDFHLLFGRVSARRPQLLAWLGLIGVFLVVAELPAVLEGRLTVLGIFNDVPFIAIATLGVSATAWTYLASMRGIRKLGGYSLKLEPYHKDRFLGLRPVGSLALSLTAAYFAFVAIFVALGIGLGPDVGAYSLIAGFIVLGLLLFFLPLTRLHQRMLLQKRADKQELDRRFAHLFENPRADQPAGDATQRLILDTLRWDIIHREIGAIATWPFDTQILSRLIVIVLTVTAILVAQAIRATIGF